MDIPKLNSKVLPAILGLILTTASGCSHVSGKGQPGPVDLEVATPPAKLHDTQRPAAILDPRNQINLNVVFFGLMSASR